MEKRKYYVVWEGRAPGIYESWEECKQQIDNYKGARYKAFPSREGAIRAYRAACKEQPELLYLIAGELGDKIRNEETSAPYICESIAVDAACSGNPGKMEYRGVYVRTGEELFHFGPEEDGTNNVGEFLAIVHGLVFLKQHRSDLPLYSDSANAILWVKQKKCNTKLERTTRNERIFKTIARAEEILKTQVFPNPVMKWNTREWGEIPADFGRKK